MPKLTAAMAKKVPIADLAYSSQQFSAGLEMELKEGFTQEDLHQTLRKMYAHLNAAIDEEIRNAAANPPVFMDALSSTSRSNTAAPSRWRGRTTSDNRQPRWDKPHGNSRFNGRQNGQATQAQVKAIFAIAKSNGMERRDIVELLEEQFHVGQPDQLTIKQASKVIDDKFAFDKELARAVLLSLISNDRIMLVGPTGSGKSSLIAQLAAHLDWPLRRINLHGETSVSDFIGVHKARNGEVFFQYGALPIAMHEGQILVLEEADAATPEILFVLQGVLEDGGTLAIADNAGEIIEPHPDFRLVATANTLGVGDESSLYTGTNVLNAAFLDRWTTVFNVGYLDDKAEAAVIRDKVPELGHSLIEGMVNLAVAVRKAVDNQDLYSTFSTRRLLALARKTPRQRSRPLTLRTTRPIPTPTSTTRTPAAATSSGNGRRSGSSSQPTISVRGIRRRSSPPRSASSPESRYASRPDRPGARSATRSAKPCSAPPRCSAPPTTSGARASPTAGGSGTGPASPKT